MKKGSTIFLRVIVLLIGLGVLALLLWEPQTEGRNVNADQFSIYFRDPFLAYVYLGSIPFFVALYQVFKLLGYIGRDKIFSQKSVRALRTIKYCALAVIGFIAGAEAFIFIMQKGKEDDIAGGVAMGVFIAFISLVIAAAAAVFERLLQNAVDIKSENDLTV